MSIILKNITKSYESQDKSQILFRDLSIEFPNKGTYCLIGKSGSRKNYFPRYNSGVNRC